MDYLLYLASIFKTIKHMWIVLKSRFDKKGDRNERGNIPKGELSLSRVVNSLEDVEKGEIFFKCNVKN